MLDLTKDADRRVEQRLQQEQIIWLTTVNAEGQPQSSPVWFLWDNGTFLHHSKADQKVRNITRHPWVALHLNDRHGGYVVSIEGTAEVLPGDSATNVQPAYLDKYGDGIKGLGLTPETMF